MTFEQKASLLNIICDIKNHSFRSSNKTEKNKTEIPTDTETGFEHIYLNNDNIYRILDKLKEIVSEDEKIQINDETSIETLRNEVTKSRNRYNDFKNYVYILDKIEFLDRTEELNKLIRKKQSVYERIISLFV